VANRLAHNPAALEHWRTVRASQIAAGTATDYGQATVAAGDLVKISVAAPNSSGTTLIQLDAAAHRFTPGRRICLQVSGGADPRYARNLGTDEDPASGTQLAPSHRTSSHGDGGFSRLVLPRPTADPKLLFQKRRHDE
jgi:hypothetical protein